MDQRVKGGTPPTTNSTVDPTSAPEDSEQDQVAEKKRRGEGENGDVGEKEEEKRGSGRKREGDKGAVLELLIEGRCGSAGQQPLQISGRETSCPEGNVRVRIGLQAKRTKKPPKILESYVCKPTIRTYQRQGRGGLLRGDGEGGVGQQSKTSSTPDEPTRDQRSGLDAVQTTSKQTASAASPPLVSSSLPSSSSSSSSQQPSLSSTFTTASSPASVPAITSQGTKSAKQVPIKLADKTELNSNGSSEKVKKEKLPSVNGQPVPAGHKPCSPTREQTASIPPSSQCIPAPPASENRSEGKTSKKHNGLVQTTKQKGLSNGKGSTDILGTSTSSKIKIRKHSSSSSVSSVDSSTRPPVSTSSPKELSLSSKSRPDSPSSLSVTPKPQSTPTVDVSSAQSQDQDPCLQPSLEKNREKERKAKKEKQDKKKVKKSKRDRLDPEKTKSESRKEEGKKKKKEKGKDGKSRHAKEREETHKTDETWRDELRIERGKVEKKRDKQSPDSQRTEDNNTNCGETVDSGKLDKTYKVVNTGSPGEIDKTDDSCKQVKQAEPATGDTSKSKEQDISRHSAVPPSHPSFSAPPSLPTPSARAPISPSCSPQEQDSRPLKKRKARRPSWTKLVHRAQRAENQEAPSDSQHNLFPQNTKMSLSVKATIQQTDESNPAPSSSLTSTFSPLPSTTKPPSPKQSHPTSDASPSASKCPITPARKRGRPKSHSSSLDEPPPKLSPNAIQAEVPPLGCDGIQKAPALEPSPILQCATQSKSSPKKRGRPPKRPLPQDQSGDALNRTDDTDRSKDFHPPERGDRQLKIRRLINEMKKRKKRRLHKVMLSGYAGKEVRGGRVADGETSLKMCKSIEATAVHTLTALSSSFGSKLGPQINVSKRGTIYMGKRRGRKPKTQTAPTTQTNSQNSTQSSLFTSPSETSLFSNQPQPPSSHPFPSPSLTHSSGAQSPYSEGSLTEPTSSLLFPHHFSLPSPSSSCTSPRPPSSSSLSPFVKKSCPCQGRHHFPFHQSSCKLSSPTPPLHHTPGSPGHLKEATPSPRSESHSEETLPSDSGIGTDNNSVSERGEIRGARGILRLGQGAGVILGAQRQPSSLADRPSPVSSPLSHMPRHTNPITNATNLERHRDRHRHRRRDYDCSSSCTCLCPCSCPGHNKCTHSDYYPCLGHNALKRQKNKHKKKHQQLHMQDPEFLAELEDLIGQFSEVHIGRRGWARTGLGQGFDGSGNAAGGRRHHSSSHSLRSNIFRINLNGFYSPHPSPYSANTAFSPQPFYPCQTVHCNRKPDRRQCGCPSKFQETIENMGFYSSYPTATALYHHVPNSYPIPSPHQYAPHQPHHTHFLLNPARFHRRRSRLLREGALGGEVEGDLGGGSGGGPHLSSGFTSSLPCGCGRNEHKHKHKHRHRHCERDMDDEEELHDDEEEDGIERERLASSKPRSGFILGQGDGGRKEARGVGSMLSKESPWLCESGNDTFCSAAAATSSSSSAERYKHTSLTSLGLGSSHLSSFGGGWGGLGQNWTKFGSLGGAGFGNSNLSWRGFTGDQPASQLIASDGEDEDDEDVQESHLHRTSPSPTHTNLFTSAAMAKGERGLRSRFAGRSLESGDRSRRRDEPAWTERRETGLQGDSRSSGQQKSVPTPVSVAGKNKRRPGRPRKHPLPSTVSSPTHSSAAPSMSSPDILPGHSHNRDGREAGGRKDERVPERDRGGDIVQQVTELELQARRKRGRKRKHGDSPCHQSTVC
uniref:histone-lysine N-methyltransferase ASH1L-like isoform X2 n=1 Tax=Scatophagus argus TaxID=75038 RepID=UPI001ED7D771|nr:histone-lysine N-methyltransferase ASH1L-like isoform X2 [Scatophagus argus]